MLIQWRKPHTDLTNIKNTVYYVIGDQKTRISSANMTSGSSTGTFNWIVPDGIQCDKIRLMVEAKHDPTNSGDPRYVVADTSNVELTIIENVFAGTVMSDTTWSGCVLIHGDIVVPVGKTLTIEAGTTVRFMEGDALSAGLDYGKSELRVFGDIEVQGTADSPVVFTSGEYSPGEGDWWGIYLDGGGKQFEYAQIEYSDWGFVAASAVAGGVQDCTFAYNQLTDIKVGNNSGALLIANNTITVGGGIGIEAGSGYIFDNEIVGIGLGACGLRFSTTNEDVTVIEANGVIGSHSSAIGMSLEYGAATLLSNEVSNCAIGIEVRAGFHRVGTDDSDSDNILHDVTTGISVTRLGGGQCPNSPMDVLINNNQVTNYTNGFYVERAPKASASAFIDAGIGVSGTNRGLNWFDDAEVSGNAIIAATSACDTLLARGNYFSPDAGAIVGDVDIAGSLSSPPASIGFETEPIEDAPGFVRITGAFPNPTSGVIRFELKSAGAQSKIDLDVIDIAGRLVRIISNINLRYGSHSVVWDGMDENQVSVANGIYFARARSGRQTSAAFRIVVAH